MPSFNAQLVNAVAVLFGPSFSISRGYSDAHDAVDIKAKLGTRLRTVDDGKVSYARNAGTDTRPNALRHWALGGGNVVNIDIDAKRTIQYAHLDTIAVKAGDKVSAGQLIGTVGETGFATGPHVHFGLWLHGNGMIDPTTYLSKLASTAASSAPSQSIAKAAKATVTVVETYDPARHFRVPRGTTLRGFDPTKPGQVLKSSEFPDGSGAHAASTVVISWPGLDPQPTPHGTFLKVSSGVFEGMFVAARIVELDPSPDPPDDGPDDEPADQAAPTPTITLVERYDPPRHFSVPAGSTIRGFHPDRPGEVLAEATFLEGSGAQAEAMVVIAWPDADPEPVPHGTFLQVFDGTFAGKFIKVQLVVLDPEPDPEVVSGPVV